MPGHQYGRTTTTGRRRTSAFTLIELIVVVIIIAVLAAIGAIAYNQYAAKARDTELVASATNIAHAITAKAAQDDLTTDAEAASVWPADPSNGAGDAALKKAFATSYGGTLTYVAGQPAGAAGSVDVAAASSSRHACIQLTAVTSLPATVHLGACGDTGGTGGGSGADDGVRITVAASGDNAQIQVSWDPVTGATGYTVTCTAAIDGDTGTTTTDGDTTTAVVTAVENFVAHTCSVTGTDASGGTVPAANSLDATPSVDLETPISGCGNIEQQPSGTTTCQTIEEDPGVPPVPTQGYGTPPPDVAGSGLWGVTSFPSTDVDPPHQFYVTDHTSGAVYQVYQAANPASSTATTVASTVGYLFGPGTFTHPAGAITGPSPVTGGGPAGITTLYIADTGTGTIWRVDPFARTRHKVATGLDNPTELTGFTCYTAAGTKTSGVCLYVATDSGVTALKLGADGATTSRRIVTAAVATGVWLTPGGTLQAATAGTVVALDPGTGQTTSTYQATAGTALGGMSASTANQSVYTVTGTAAGQGQVVGVDGHVYATGLDYPRDVHDHQNAPWQYFTTPTALWMVDTASGQLVKVWGHPAATLTRVAGLGAGAPGAVIQGALATNSRLDSPSWLTFDPQGNLYISETYHVARVDAVTGTIATVVNGPNDYLLSSGIAAAPDGALYMENTDSSAFGGLPGSPNWALLKMPDGGTGTPERISGTPFAAYVSSLTTDSAGNLFLTQVSGSCVWKMDAGTGAVSVVAGVCNTAGYSGDGGPATSALLNNPRSVAVDDDGNLYITDTGNNVVRKVNAATGTITTIAGTGTAGYTGDGGAGTAAQLNQPWGIAVDHSGNVYFADSQNDVVREVDATTGVVQTVVLANFGTGLGFFNPVGMTTGPDGNVYVVGGSAVFRISVH